jgi:hypothetical protein
MRRHSKKIFASAKQLDAASERAAEMNILLMANALDLAVIIFYPSNPNCA